MIRHRLHDPTFSHFSRTPTCGIDKQTGRHTTMAYAHTVLAWRCAVKTVRCATIVPWYRPVLLLTITGALSTSCPPPGFGVICAGSVCNVTSAGRVVSRLLWVSSFRAEGQAIMYSEIVTSQYAWRDRQRTVLPTKL